MRKLALITIVLLWAVAAFATEQFNNLASTTTTGQISGATTLAVVSATGFPSSGNFTEAFNNPSGGTLEWTGGAQPGYTLTQGNGDFYQCNYNGTNVYCHQTLSNVLCE